MEESGVCGSTKRKERGEKRGEGTEGAVLLLLEEEEGDRALHGAEAEAEVIRRG